MYGRTDLVYVCPQTLLPLSEECGYARLNIQLSFRHDKVTLRQSQECNLL